MKVTKLATIFSFLVVVFLTTACNTFAQDQRIDLKKVPVNVLSAFHKAYPTAEITGTSIGKEKGRYYEIESVQGTKHIDLLLTHSGKITEVEETIPENELPAPVMKTLQAKFKGLKINKAERVTSNKKVTYELSIESNKKRQGIVLWPNGKIVNAGSMKGEEEKGEKGEKGANDND